MLNTLSLRNARRSVKDYIVYVITMTIISSLMFAFNGLLFSEAVAYLIKVMESIYVFIGMASFFVVLIMIWLTKYIINFMLERRGREFGTYLLIGMRKKQVAKMFRKEHIILGMITFLLGIIPGYFMHITLVNIFFSIFGAKYQFSVDININTYLLTLAFYAGTYILVLFRVNRKFKKMEIRELLYLENKNEQPGDNKEVKKKAVFFISLAYIIFFHIAIYAGFALSNILMLYIAVFIAAIYGLFYGLSGYLVSYIQKQSKTVNRGANLFIFRQLASKIKTMRVTMGTLTILFVVTILSWMGVLLFSGYQNQVLDDTFMNIDVLYFSDEVTEDFGEQIQVIEKYGSIEEDYSYHIYKNNYSGLNDYLYAQLTGAFTDTINENSYFEDDTYMLLSDYNYLRKMTGYEEISLPEGHYLIQAKDRLKEQIDSYGNSTPLEIGCDTLTYQTLETIPFTQIGINGADYLIIVPDVYKDNLEAYYSVLAVDVESDLMYEMDQELRSTSGYFYDDDLKEMKIPFGVGSDQLITVGDPILVRESMLLDQYGAISSLSFTLGYIGVVFLIVAMSILAIQQLSDAAKYKYRYQILKNLGMNQKERNLVIFKQLAVYYLCPVVIAIFISMFVGMMMSSGFVLYTGLKMFGIFYYLVSIAIFLGIFLIYFAITYISFIRTIEK